jgi:hypothetical protein
MTICDWLLIAETLGQKVNRGDDFIYANLQITTDFGQVFDFKRHFERPFCQLAAHLYKGINLLYFRSDASAKTQILTTGATVITGIKRR